MSKKKIRIGFIGAGAMASRHLEVLSSFDDVVLAGIFSRTRSKAEVMAQQFGIAYCANDLKDLVATAKPQALYITVSEEQMHRVVMAAIPYGLPLFIEKPAGLNTRQAKELAKAARRHKTKTMVGYNRRFYSAFHKGLDIIRKHGRLFGVTVEGHERMWKVRENSKFTKKVLDHWIFANSTHTIDLLRLFGGEVKRVHAFARREFKEARGDQFAATIDFKDGALGQYQSHWYSPGGWRVVLYGNGVTVEFKPLEQGRWTDKEFNAHDITPDEDDVKFKPGFKRQARAFIDMARSGKLAWPGLDLEGAYQTMALAQRLSKI